MGISESRLTNWITEVDKAAKLADVDPQVAAADLVSELKPRDVRDLAIRYLVEKVADRRRAKVLHVEQSTQRSNLTMERVSGPSVNLVPQVGRPMHAKRGSKRYQEWVDTTEEGKAYEEYQQETDRILEANADRRRERMWQLVDEYIEDSRMEWTTELLNSAIAMPDGSVVLWGDATIEQHTERRDMFLQNALSNAEGATRHEQAIRDLTAAQVSSLRELTRVGAQQCA